MKTIGVRELKAHLSRVLREVSSGDTFLVTDRGRVVAELRRPDGIESSAGVSAEDRALARLASAGVLRIAERPRPAYAKSPLKSAKGTAQSLLNADRGE